MEYLPWRLLVSAPCTAEGVERHTCRHMHGFGQGQPFRQERDKDGSGSVTLHGAYSYRLIVRGAPTWPRRHMRARARLPRGRPPPWAFGPAVFALHCTHAPRKPQRARLAATTTTGLEDVRIGRQLLLIQDTAHCAAVTGAVACICRRWRYHAFVRVTRHSLGPI